MRFKCKNMMKLRKLFLFVGLTQTIWIILPLLVAATKLFFFNPEKLNKDEDFRFFNSEILASNNFDGYIDKWITLRSNKKNLLYLFSAYNDQDEEGKPVVRLISVGKRNNNETDVDCWFTYRNTTKLKHSSGYFQQIRQFNHTEYTAKWVVCPLTDALEPQTVCIQAAGSQKREVKVHHPRRHNPTLRSLNVCVRALYGGYDNAAAFAEFVEHNRMNGVQHFTFYKESVGPNLNKILLHYEKLGITTVLPHNLPEDLNVVSKAQHATYQDCFLRSRGYFQYVMYLDLDEFIVPRKHPNFLSMIQEVDSERFSAILVPRINFCMNHPNNKTAKDLLHKVAKNYSSDVPLGLNTQLYTLRAPLPCPLPLKGKAIVKPWNVHETNVHRLKYSVKGYRSFNLDSSIAMLQHYRPCPTDAKRYVTFMRPCPHYTEPVIDTFLHKNFNSLSSRVIQTLRDSGII